MRSYRHIKWIIAKDSSEMLIYTIINFTKKIKYKNQKLC